MTFFIQINDSEPVGFETQEAFEHALSQAKGKGWVRQWQDHGDGQRRMHKRMWR
jgi:hypothetical protein